jgi:hypothetical protein
MKTLAAGWLVLALLLSCKPNAQESQKSEAKSATDTLYYRVEEKTKQHPSCETDESKCLTVSLSYPVFDEQDSIGAALNRLVCAAFWPGSQGGSLVYFEDTLFNYYDALMKNEVLEGNWQIEKLATVGYNQNQQLSIFIESYEYTGGAQDISNISYINLDAANGKELTLADVLVVGFEEPLHELAGQYVKAELQQLLKTKAMAETLAKHGIDFYKPPVWGLCRDGLQLFYPMPQSSQNETETISITIPFEALKTKGLLRMNLG